MKYMTYEESKELERLAREHKMTECSIYQTAGPQQTTKTTKQEKQKQNKARAASPRKKYAVDRPR